MILFGCFVDKGLAFISGINVKQFDTYYKCNYADEISIETLQHPKKACKPIRIY